MNIIPKILNLAPKNIIPSLYAMQTNNYAAPLNKSKKLMKSVQKVKIPVETDVKKLLSHVCGSNIYVEGEDVKLKPDSEYPDWLWTLHTGKPLQLHELDPSTKAYWRKVRTLGMRKYNLDKKRRRARW